MNSNGTARYIVRHEVYEQSPFGIGRTLIQEWEETRTLPAFFQVGHTDCHEGNPLHLVSIEALAG
jgi:hypothetical protein